jgi:hypothetical protein
MEQRISPLSMWQKLLAIATWIGAIGQSEEAKYESSELF